MDCRQSRHGVAKRVGRIAGPIGLEGLPKAGDDSFRVLNRRLADDEGGNGHRENRASCAMTSAMEIATTKPLNQRRTLRGRAATTRPQMTERVLMIDRPTAVKQTITRLNIR